MKKKLLSIMAAAFTSAAIAQTARVQVIHNSADPAASVVDVYANGVLLLDDFKFRTAIPYTSLPAGVDIELAVAPATSSDPTGGGAADIIPSTKQTVKFTAGETYVAIANGLLSGDKLFQIYASGGSESTTLPKVGLKFFHGATDAPAVDVVARGVATLAPNLSYGNFSSTYVEVPAAKYVVDINLAGTSTTVISYDVNLIGVDGESAVVFASGFLVPSGEQKGFGVFVALSNGVVIELPVAQNKNEARVQVIHNSAEPAAGVVDVYANGVLLIDDFEFRSATPYTSLPAGVDIELAVAPSTSSDSTGGGAADIIPSTKQTVNFDSGATYVAIANGLLSGDKLFQIYASGGSESTTLPKVGLKFFHGATDAPAVDIVARGVATLAPNLSYGNFSSSYVEVPASSYIVDINVAGTSTTVISYDVDLTGLEGESGVIFASGFLNPTGQQKSFSVFAALVDGTVVELPNRIETGLLSSSYDYNAKLIYPNPATSVVTVDNTNLQSLQFCDNAGALVKSFNGSIPSTIDISDLKPGMYVVRAQQNNLVKTIKLSVTQ